MSRFSLLRHSLTALSVVYDTAIGNGVDSAGFAALPLRPGGTNGADLATGAPTPSGATTYTAGTRTLANATGSSGVIATWTGILTGGTTYRLLMSIVNTGFAHFHIKTEAGVAVWSKNMGSGGGLQQFLIDETFVADGANLILYCDNDVFKGSIQIGMVAANSGGTGAHRFYVNPSTGSDSNTPLQALDATTPLATIAAAAALVRSGAGDQILLAQGATFAEYLPALTALSGFSLLYPLTIQSYDPADALNEAKLGRASGANRPVISGSASSAFIGATGTLAKYIAVRGLDFNAGNIASQILNIVAASGHPVDGILLENNLLRYGGVAVDQLGAGTNSQHLIVRNNAIYGVWASGGHIQPLYAGSVDHVTVEDNVLWHCGWKIGASRDDTIANGGLVGDDIYRHSAYIQNTCSDIIYRRNLVVDGPDDGGHLLSDTLATENVIFDCPIAFDISGGVNYQTVRPSGVNYAISYNLILGSVDINASYPRGIGLFTRNGSPGSATHHNVFGYSGATSGHYMFETGANWGKPSYMDYHNNVGYLWAISGQAFVDVPDNTTTPTSDVHTAYANNFWDNPDSGTNVNIASATLPNPYNVDGLISAAGFTGVDAAARKQALMDYAIANPEAHIQRTLLNLGLPGYGISHSIPL